MGATATCHEVTMEEALKHLRLGGDFDLIVRGFAALKYAFRVRDDVLHVSLVGDFKWRAYSGSTLLTSEHAVLKLILAVLRNAESGGKTHVEMH